MTDMTPEDRAKIERLESVMGATHAYTDTFRLAHDPRQPADWREAALARLLPLKVSAFAAMCRATP
jgi:hypothetical protein